MHSYTIRMYFEEGYSRGIFPSPLNYALISTVRTFLYRIIKVRVGVSVCGCNSNKIENLSRVIDRGAQFALLLGVRNLSSVAKERNGRKKWNRHPGRQ